MKLTSMQSRITIRLDNDLEQSLNILHKATQLDKAKLIRKILKDFFDKNEALIDKYYKEIQAQ